MTHAVLTGISFAVPADGTAPTIAVFLVLPALFTASMSVGAGFWLPASANAQTFFVLRWALAEAASIFGFVAYFLSGSHLWQIPCVAAGVIAVLLAFPSEAAVRARPGGVA
jgi:hypothetical protein